MVVLMFQGRFANKVRRRKKRQTIRPRRKRRIRVGDELSLRRWSARAYMSPQVTLGFSRKNVAQLATMMDAGEVGDVLFLFSHYFINTSRNESAYLLDVLTPRGVRIAAMRTHAKILLIETDSHAVVVETSANLRSCHNVEQFVIADDRALLDFHLRWIINAIKKVEHAQTKITPPARDDQAAGETERTATRRRVPVADQRRD